MGRLSSFRHVRARIFRTGEGPVWLSAWVQHLGPKVARLLVVEPVSLRHGESMAVVCYGDGALARFAARASAQAGPELDVTIEGPVVFAPSEEDVRLRVDSVYGSMRAGKVGGVLLATDASPGSLGGRSDAAFAPGAILDLSLSTPVGRVHAEVGVLNCREEARGGHRLGLRILDASRIDLALWGRMLRERNV